MKLAVAVLVAVLGVSAAQAAQAPIKVQGFAKIDTFQVRGKSGPADARRAFGKPTSVKSGKGECTYTWAGLQISLYTLFHNQQCRDWSSFGSATITGPWVTERGLRRGDSIVRAKQLYPVANKPGRSTATSVWLIVRFSQAIGDYGLSAGVSHGRVTTLRIDDRQGGE